jgi:hypothetical protein
MDRAVSTKNGLALSDPDPVPISYCRMHRHLSHAQPVLDRALLSSPRNQRQPFMLGEGYFESMIAIFAPELNCDSVTAMAGIRG